MSGHNKTNQFKNESENHSNLDVEEQNIPESEEQKMPTQTRNKPFDNPSTSSNEARCFEEQITITNGEAKLGEDRDRYAVDEDDDSVRSMLEMMDTKNDPENRRKNKSLQVRAKRSLNKWMWKSPPSLLGGMSSDDEESIISYDCIALSSLRKKLRPDSNTLTSEEEEDEDDDEELLRTKQKSVFETRDDDAKSQGTTTTKNTGHGSDADLPVASSLVVRTRSQRLKYAIPIASFLAIVLLLGIFVLGYSLHALRQNEDEDISVFNEKFWREDLPKTLAFWKQNDNDGED